MLRQGESNEINLLSFVTGEKKNELNLKGNDIEDKDVQVIAAFLAEHPEIDSLTLSENNLTDKGLIVFASQKHLFFLDISKNPRVTLQGIEKLWQDERNTRMFDVLSEHVDAVTKAVFKMLLAQKDELNAKASDSSTYENEEAKIFDDQIDASNRINFEERQSEIKEVSKLRNDSDELKKQNKNLDEVEKKTSESKIEKLLEIKQKAEAEEKKIEASLSAIRDQIKSLIIEYSSGTIHRQIIETKANTGREIASVDRAISGIDLKMADVKRKISRYYEPVAKADLAVKAISQKYAQDATDKVPQKKLDELFKQLNKAKDILKMAQETFEKVKITELEPLELELQKWVKGAAAASRQKVAVIRNGDAALAVLQTDSKRIGKEIETLRKKENDLNSKKNEIKDQVTYASRTIILVREKVKTDKVIRDEKLVSVGTELQVANVKVKERKAKLKFNNIKYFIEETWKQGNPPDHILELKDKLLELEAKGNYDSNFNEFLKFARKVALTAPATQSTTAANFLKLFEDKANYLVLTAKYFSPEEFFLTNKEAEAIVKNYINDIETTQFGLRVNSLFGSDVVTTASGESKTLPSHMAIQHREFQKEMQLAEKEHRPINYVELLKAIKTIGARAAMGRHSYRKDPATERYEMCLPINAEKFNEVYSSYRSREPEAIQLPDSGSVR